MARKPTSDTGISRYSRSPEFVCSTCCEANKCFGPHRVILVDLGEGQKYYCVQCLDARIDAILAANEPEAEVEVEGDTVTLDGVDVTWDFGSDNETVWATKTFTLRATNSSGNVSLHLHVGCILFIRGNQDHVRSFRQFCKPGLKRPVSNLRPRSTPWFQSA